MVFTKVWLKLLIKLMFGKGVSKETKSALGSFVNYSEKSSKILDKMRINHGEITQKNHKN